MNHRLFLSTLALLVLPPLAASATPITPQSGSPTRTNTGRALRADDDYAASTGIDAADCLGDEPWKFALTIDDTVTYAYVDVWASTEKVSCADPDLRTGTSPKCWRVKHVAQADALAGALTIPASAMVRSAFRKLSDGDASAFTTTTDVCTVDADQQPTRFYLHFLLMTDATTVAGSTTANEYEYTYDTVYDLHGPTAPSGLVLGPGENVLLAQWTSQTVVKDFAGYRAYCYPTAGSEGDAGTSTAADGCPTLPTTLAGFAEGKIPDAAVQAQLCGSMSTTGNSFTLKNLKDGVSYAVAIAAVDDAGNTGALSKVACLAPQPTNDFYDAYRGAGGQAGGGFCTLGAPRGRTALAGLLGLVALGALARRRRTANGARRADGGAR